MFSAVRNENFKKTEEKLDDIGARTELGADNICRLCLLNIGR
jgi:hypothetical protein